MKKLLILVLFTTIFACKTAEKEKPGQPDREQPKMMVLYGLEKQGIFQGKTDTAIVKTLQNWGITGVFLNQQESNLAKLLRQEGIRVYLSIGLFSGRKYWEKYPSCRPVKANGQVAEQEDWYAGVNPADDEVRQDRLKAVWQIVQNPDIDGIWLDAIRWPCYWEVFEPNIYQSSFDEKTLIKFLNYYKLRLPPDMDRTMDIINWLLAEQQKKWTEWKCYQITSFVFQVRKIINSVNPNLILGIFTVPWRAQDYDSAIVKIIGQDNATLGQYVDIVSPMVYHAMCNQPVSWIGEIATWTAVTARRPVWPIIQIVDHPRQLTPDEIAIATDTALRAGGSRGIIFFRQQGLNAERIEIIKAKGESEWKKDKTN